MQKKSSSIREFSARPGVLLVDEHAFDSLERPELFKDAFHLNNAGCARFSVTHGTGGRQAAQVMPHAI